MIRRDVGLPNQVGPEDFGMRFGSYSMAQVSKPGQENDNGNSIQV